MTKRNNKITIAMFPPTDNCKAVEARRTLIKIYNEMLRIRDKTAKNFQSHGLYPNEESLKKVKQNILILRKRIPVYYNFKLIIEHKEKCCKFGKNIEKQPFESSLDMFNWVLSNANNKENIKKTLNENLKYRKMYDIENYYLYEAVLDVYSFLIRYLCYFTKYIRFSKKSKLDAKSLYEEMGKAVLNNPKSVSVSLISDK
ncbi:MAG: hypothetical protein ACRC7R_07220 [Sarcina sp.]